MQKYVARLMCILASNGRLLSVLDRRIKQIAPTEAGASLLYNLTKGTGSANPLMSQRWTEGQESDGKSLLACRSRLAEHPHFGLGQIFKRNRSHGSWQCGYISF